MSKHTPGPWTVAEYNDCLGYDCMTGGVKVGPLYLDGASYGQRTCTDIDPDALARMMADAHLISAAPDLLYALDALLHATMYKDHPSESDLAIAAIKKAKGK